MKIKSFKFDKGWKILLYFDVLLPAILYFMALLFPVSGIRSFFALFFHSYSLYIVKTIPDFALLTGIAGLLYHIAIILYTIKKRNVRDLIICILITAIITLFFILGLNYQIIKPLSFG